MNPVICHLDLDAFFASVEQNDNPEYKGKPVIVGAKPGGRGVVSACSYEARKYGIHSAMPISEAYRRCRNGIFLPVRMKRYIEVSKSIMDIIKDYSPVFKQISIDEAYIDLTGTEKLLGAPHKTAEKIKNRVLEKAGITISIGLAPNYYLAKLASEAGKPDGLFTVEKGHEEEFLNTLTLKDLWGVGKTTITKLKELNITDIKKLRSFPEEILSSMLGKASGRFLYNAVRGTDPGIIHNDIKNHSISNEVTFSKDTKDPENIKKVLLGISGSIMSKLIDKNQKSKTVFIKLRYEDFSTFTAQKTSKYWITNSESIYSTALELFNKKWNGFTPIRLIGLGVSGVVSENFPDQLELFAEPDDKKKKVEETITKIKKKMKNIKLTKASLLDNE
jgi:DNA polymerase IV